MLSIYQLKRRFICSPLLVLLLIAVVLYGWLLSGRLPALRRQSTFHGQPPNCFLDNEIRNAFRVGLNATELAAYVELIRVFVAAMENANLTYYMSGGTFIGSLRHHGFIPWDDDLDFHVSAPNASPRIQAALAGVSDRYELRAEVGGYYRFYPLKGSTKVDRGWMKWRHPLLDIDYHEGLPGDWQAINTVEMANKSSPIFPVKKRPFMNMMLNGPAKPSEYLQRLYANVYASGGNLSVCISPNFSHKLAVDLTQMELDCEHLFPCFPFVFRRSVPGGGVLEELRIGGEDGLLLSSVVIS